jgi:hypothetical protein
VSPPFFILVFSKIAGAKLKEKECMKRSLISTYHFLEREESFFSRKSG